MEKDCTEGLAERLGKAIPEDGIREFHRQMEERKVRGSSYAMVHRYLSGKATPSLEFLEAAADVLGVRPAWLICGSEEHTDAEAAVSGLLEELAEDAAFQLAPQVDDPEAVINAFHGAIRRLVVAVREEPDPDQVTRTAEILVGLVREPLDRLRHQLFIGTRQVQDFYVAQIHALTLIMPHFRSVDRIETIIEKLEGSTDAKS